MIGLQVACEGWRGSDEVLDGVGRGVVLSPQTILYNHSHSGLCRCAVAAEFFGHASHKTLWLVEYLCPMNTFLFLQRTAISSELSGVFNSSSA